MKGYTYDVECYPNFFSITFLPITAPKKLTDLYIKIDIALRCAKTQEEKVECLAHKKSVMQSLGVVQFVIYRDYTSSGWSDKGNITQIRGLQNFLAKDISLIGYNSYNYDSIMLDLFIYNSSSFDANTGLSLRVNDGNGRVIGERIHITEFLNTESQRIIESGKLYFQYSDMYKGRRYKRLFKDFDIQKILYLDKTFTSLKSVAICLKWYRIQDLPIPFDSLISRKDIILLLDYNLNDVLITDCLVKNQWAEMTLRSSLSELYNLDLRNLSRSSIGKRLMSYYYGERTGLEYADYKDLRTHRSAVPIRKVIQSLVKFQTKEFRALYDTLCTQTIKIGLDFKDSEEEDTKINQNLHLYTNQGSFRRCTLLYNETMYTIAVGGIHSQDDPLIIDNKKGRLIDWDVTSMYPSIMLRFKLAPHHLDKKAFLDVLEMIVTERVKAKHAGEKLRADALKIVINRMYGALKDINDYLYDPEVTYAVTINGQLLILMCCEALELAGIHVLSANTDGILIRVPDDKTEKQLEIIKWWEDYTKLGFEAEYFEKYIRSDINSYIGIYEGLEASFNEFKEKGSFTHKGKTYTKESDLLDKFVKLKGFYVPEIPFNKGFIYPVVKIALTRYFLFDIPFEDTINNHIKSSDSAVYDYCFAQKINKKYKCIFKTTINGDFKDIELQKDNRFFVVKSKGGTAVKVDSNSKEINLQAGRKLQVFNDYFKSDDYDIHFGFYVNECLKRLYGNGKKGKSEKRGIINNTTNLFNYDR